MRTCAILTDRIVVKGGKYIKEAFILVLAMFAILGVPISIGIDAQPDSAATWNEKGTFFYNQGKYGEALQAFNNALEFDPRSPQIWYNTGNALYSQGKYEESIKAYDVAVELDPQNAYAWLAKGKAYYYLKKYYEAIPCFDKALESNPQYADAWYNKGLVLKLLGKDSDAETAFAKAKELGHIDPPTEATSAIRLDKNPNKLNNFKGKVLSGYKAKDYYPPLNPNAVKSDDAKWANEGSGGIGRPDYTEPRD